jgi:phosphate starvation-inducible protein PhoH
MRRSKKADTSVYVPQRNKLAKTLNIRELSWTQKQKEFIKLALNKDVKLIFIKGPAGSAKTILTTFVGLQMLSDKKIDELVYIRSAVESSDSKLGFLPGTVDEKLQYYNIPFYDKLEELLSESDARNLVLDKRATSFPVNYARGMTWNVKCISADELQNSSLKEIITLMTRLGKHSKMFLSADVDQSDLPTSKQGGFQQAFDMFSDEESKENGIYTFEFTDDDIMRSELVKFIVKKQKQIKKT